MIQNKSWGQSTKSTSLFNSGTPHKNDYALIRCKEAESKEKVFLHIKNKELQERSLKMADYIIQIERQKKQLIKLNANYVETLNQEFKSRYQVFNQETKKIKNKAHTLCKHCNKTILVEFEKDYRNLVKHCIILEQEISSKNKDLGRYGAMKKELKETKHDSIGQLVAQLVDTTLKTVQLKKENNYIQFENEKFKRELDRIKRNGNLSMNELSQVQTENQNFKSLINTIQNESIDRDNQYKSKIYEMEVTIEKLEKEIRGVQGKVQFHQKRSQEMRAKQIESIQQSQEKPPTFKRSLSLITKNHLNLKRQINNR